MISYLALHHSGGVANDIYAKSQHLDWMHIDSAHKQRWNFKSSLGYYGGYNFYIESNGKYTQFRAVGEETAAQIGYNFNTVSICMAGNFLEKNGVKVEQPTQAQIETQKKIIRALIDNDFTEIALHPNTTVKITLSSIHPHSFYQQTQCNCFPDAWGRELMKEAGIPIKTRQTAVLSLVDSIILLIQKLRAELLALFQQKPLGGIDRGCTGMS